MGTLKVIKVIRTRRHAGTGQPADDEALPKLPSGFPQFTFLETVTGAMFTHDDAMAHVGYFTSVDQDVFSQRHRKTVAGRFAKIGLGYAFPPSIRDQLDAATHLRSLFVDDLPFRETAIISWARYVDTRIKNARPDQRLDILLSFGFASGEIPLHNETNMPKETIAIWGMVSDNKGLAYGKAMDWLGSHSDVNRHMRSDAPPFALRSGINTESMYDSSPTVPHVSRGLICFGTQLTCAEAEGLIRKAECAPGSFRDLLQHLTPEMVIGRENPLYPADRESEFVGGIVSGAPIVALLPTRERGVACFSASSAFGVTLDFASLGGSGFPPKTRFMALVLPHRMAP